jgi:hypothetical protein
VELHSRPRRAAVDQGSDDRIATGERHGGAGVVAGVAAAGVVVVVVVVAEG